METVTLTAKMKGFTMRLRRRPAPAAEASETCRLRLREIRFTGTHRLRVLNTFPARHFCVTEISAVGLYVSG